MRSFSNKYDEGPEWIVVLVFFAATIATIAGIFWHIGAY